MVKYNADPLNATFSALADPTRRAILSNLAKSDSSVTELAKPFNVSLPAVMKHLVVLEKAGLIIREKKGRVSHCRLNANPMLDAAEWIIFYEQFWTTKLNALESHLRRRHGRHHP